VAGGMARVEVGMARRRTCWSQVSRSGCSTPWQFPALIPRRERMCSRGRRGSRCMPWQEGCTSDGSGLAEERMWSIEMVWRHRDRSAARTCNIL
jgi:hypothetical protein